MKWDDRRKRIVDLLLSSGADIICLQEIDVEPRSGLSNKSIESSEITFLNDYKEIIGADYGYFIHNKTNQRTSSIGNAILWKKSLFNIIKCENTSCSNIINFEYIATEYKFKLANVHLKAGLNSGENTRLSQIKSICKRNPDIICGDFNDDFNADRSLHKFVSSLSYTIHNNQKTCCVANENHFKYWCLDNILTKKDIINVENIKDLSCIKIPNDDNPSDHLPIIFTLTPEMNLL